MKIDFVRHGQSEHNKLGVINGQTMNGSLSEEGIKQAYETSEKLSNDYARIYSSDLIRAKETAEILNKKLNLEIIYDIRLRERSLGSFEGKSWKDVGSELKEIDRIQKYDYRPYGGESVDNVKERLLSFINEIKQAEKKEKILVVAHGGIIRLLHHLFSGEVPETIHNASIHEFEFKN